MKKSTVNRPLRWTEKEISVLRQNISIKEMEALLPKRNYFTITSKRNTLGISNPSARERVLKAWETRRAKTNITVSKVLKPKSDFKFIMNGVPVTIDGSIKNAFVGKDRIEINF